MKKWIVAASLAASGALLLAATLEASGSIGAGAGKINARAAYSQGKALTFDHIACSSCPLQKGDLDKDRAMSLTASLVAVYDGGTTGSPDDEAVGALCTGDAAPGSADCKMRMEMVHYFLSRRYKL